MTFIVRIINKVYTLLNTKENSDVPSFFDYSAKEKKKIIERAAEESVSMQTDLVKRYNKLQSRPTNLSN